MEPQPALVRAERGVELHPEPAIDLPAPGVIDPWYPEHDLALRLDETLQDAGLDILGMLRDDRRDRFEHLAQGLVELRLTRVA